MEFFCLHSNILESIGSCSIEKSFLPSYSKQLDVKDFFECNKEIERMGKPSAK